MKASRQPEKSAKRAHAYELEVRELDGAVAARTVEILTQLINDKMIDMARGS